MATEEIQISQLELAQEVQGDMVFAVDTATDTKSLSVNQLKNHISQPLQENINAVDTSALHKYNISNCITEIPQDIKLEINSNGKTVIKAGSKVYIPNGLTGTTPKFDIVTITSDVTTNQTLWRAQQYYLIVQSNGNSLNHIGFSSIVIGTTEPTPTNGNWWYDTTNNKIKKANGTSWDDTEASLPVGLITSTNGTTASSIDQVFNGFGYIGSTVFALPGVKGLIPNGRNADGSLKSTEFVTSNVLRFTRSDSATEVTNIALNGNSLSYHRFVYDNVTNTTTAPGFMNAGNISYVGGRITSLTPKTAFHAVDYNDFEKAMLKEDWVKVSTVPASPDHDKFYYIPEN